MSREGAERRSMLCLQSKNREVESFSQESSTSPLLKAKEAFSGEVTALTTREQSEMGRGVALFLPLDHLFVGSLTEGSAHSGREKRASLPVSLFPGNNSQPTLDWASQLFPIHRNTTYQGGLAGGLRRRASC
ncbi:hypothetical protein EWB00_001677 [Schistosoma japonicum]|uniref:Uncharacterized protein n=1 Tax=Schistosoma japonicum TaxID=6182 RepID=A0A4Z2CJV5_SCHJA|nr:hypothetical protein EWB00_001677 [Schistosoma japonicum]